MLKTTRLKKELSQLLSKPPIGIKVNVNESSTSVLEAGKSYIKFICSQFIYIFVLFVLCT